ncbi:MAG TPA: hypothetical protein VEY08_15460 [Chloroflexia bacterium]|nr:hypothetical protein [Chloroflexia bacterium]
MQALLTWLLNEEAGVVGLLRSWGVWLVLLLVAAGSVAAYQRPATYVVDVGSRQDQAYTRNFHARLEEPSRTYRWSDVYGYVTFPGAGGARPFTVTATLDPARPAAVEIFVNGERFFAADVGPGWRDFAFTVDESHPAALASRDTVVEFRAPEYRAAGDEGEAKGLKVDRVVLEQAPAGGFIWPSLATVAFTVLSTLLVYLLVGRALAGISRPEQVRGRAVVLALVAGTALCLLLAASRTAASAAVPHVAATLASMLVILVVAERLVVGLFAGIGGRGARLLALAIALAFGVRFGGMALPQSVIIDMPYHMKWLRTLLAGNWQALYLPGGLSEVPPEWGMSLLIPKSPLFYLAAAPLNILPFDLEILVKWLICFLDASLVALAYWFAVRVSVFRRTALAAACLYAVMPLAFRAFSYGILPTIFAQWLAAGLFAFVLAFSVRRWRPATLLVGALLATLTLLAFPTVAVFVTLVVAFVPLGWWLARRARAEPSFSWQPYLVLAAGWLLAIVLYYGLYIEPVAASAQALLAPAPGGGTTVRWPGGVAELVAWTADYLASTLPVVLAALGVLLLWARKRATGLQTHAAILLGAWLAIGPVFMAANYKVDMIGKHLFFTMLPVAVLGGLGLAALGGRGAWGRRLAGLTLGTVAWQALVFWVERLVRAST